MTKYLRDFQIVFFLLRKSTTFVVHILLNMSVYFLMLPFLYSKFSRFVFMSCLLLVYLSCIEKLWGKYSYLAKELK